MPLASLIPAGLSVISGLFANSGASAARRRQNRLSQEGLGYARDNYGGRSPFRDAAEAQLGQPGTDWQQFFDPSMYQEQGVSYTPSDRSNRAGQDYDRSLAMTQNIDRLQMVKDAIKSFDVTTAPDYEADQRSALSHAAQGGALGSGALNTSLGDLSLTRSIKRQGLTNQLIGDATEGSIDDRYRALGASERARGFEREDDDAAYDRSLTERNRGTDLRRQSLSDRMMLADQTNQERSGRFRDALGLGQFGYGNDPSEYLARMAGGAGDEADDLGDIAGMNFSQLGELLASLQRLNPGAGRGLADGGSRYG